MSWLTAEEALAALGTKPQSLYASVSRGRIRARTDPADPRRSLYARDDVERLARRGAGRPKTIDVAAEAILWGAPVLPSAVSTVRNGRLSYRGRDAVELADTASIEDVAGLLWETGRPDLAASLAPGNAGTQPLQRAFVAIAARAAADAPSAGRSPESLRQDSAALVGALAAALTGETHYGPLHRRLASAWRRPEAAGLIRRALVLLADHELNPSTFAARIAASTGAPLSGAVLAGLATLIGPAHGGASEAVTRLAGDLGRHGPATASGVWSKARGRLAGFGHPLYPGGDPRATALLDLFPLPPAFAELSAIGRDLTGEAPNIDFALAALAAGFDLPPDAPLQLFALARSVGWLAHAMEQVQSGAPIRPRASYVGPSPPRRGQHPTLS